MDQHLNVNDYLRRHIRTVPDWPAPGVQFRDTTPLLQNPKVFRVLIEDLIATGGTMMDGKKLLDKLGGSDRLRESGLPLFTLAGFRRALSRRRALSEARRTGCRSAAVPCGRHRAFRCLRSRSAA